MKLDWQKVAAAILMLLLSLLCWMGKKAVSKLEGLEARLDSMDRQIVAIGAKLEVYSGGAPFKVGGGDGTDSQ